MNSMNQGAVRSTRPQPDAQEQRASTKLRALLDLWNPPVISFLDDDHAAIVDRHGEYFTHEQAAQLIAALTAFYDHPDSAAFIAEKNERVRARYEAGLKPTPRHRKGLKPGLVYLLEADGFYKVGITRRDIQARVKDLQNSTPSTITVVHTISTDDPEKLESELHQKFDSKRMSGEWFTLADDDVAYIKSIGGAL